MNKLIFLYIFLCSTIIHADTLAVHRTNNIGRVGIDILESKADGFYVTGKKIGTQLSAKNMKMWNHIMSAPKRLQTASKGQVCSLGTVTFKLTKSGQKISQDFEACASGEGYAEVLAQIYELKRSPVSN